MFNALVVDDNRSTADSIVSVLVALGIRAKAAYGTRSGMAALRSETPDMIFLDINMPGVSGLELLSFTKREPRLNKVPVFVCTSDDQPQTKQQALAAGANEFLLKPVTVDALEEVLKRTKFL